MTIFILFWLLPTFFLTTASPTEAQQTSKIFRIGFLDASTASSSAVRLAPFWQEMRKLGWIEGSNMIIESRFAEEKGDRLPELAAELVRLKVDIIVGASTAASLAAKSATTTIPIVMTNSSDPVGAGLVASLGAAGRQRHRAIGFNGRAKHQKAGGAQGHSPQTRPCGAATIVGNPRRCR